MTRTQVSAIAFAFSTLFAGQAMAADNGPVTRAQVQAELAEAIRTGNMVYDEGGRLLNEVFPHNYPAQEVTSKSRAQVRAELAEAIRTGNMAYDESGQQLNEVFPHNYADKNVASKTREQVKAELAEAASNGSLYQNTGA